MNTATRTLSVLLSLLSLATVYPAEAAEGVGEITVYADRPTVVLPETLYGLFYEDINYSGDGGLYAELIQNRSFEYYPVQGSNPLRNDFHPLYAWKKVERGDGRCEISVEKSVPLNTNNRNYVHLKIHAPGDGVGLENRGFDGISVVGGDTYDFSFYAKRVGSLDAPVHVLLKGEAGEIGKASIGRLSAEWTKYEVSLTAKDTDGNARLVVLTTGQGDLWMDMISLFPRKTFKGRKNGLREILRKALADLKPATFRFPGGCIAHGHGLDNAYRWKDTVGDVAQRKPNWNLWGYHQSYGLGYFEYFQFCEDIGAEPLPILPVGVSCGFRRPFQNEEMGTLKEWVDDAVDLLEFANGPPDSRWGRVRAEMGHPEPFHLKFIGLGNEDHHTDEFEERFPHFVKAIRAKDPSVKIVGTSGLGHQIPIYEFMAEQGADLSDEHYYEGPEWFIANQNRFDDFDRSGPKVFVGEYASRGNRLYNAVAEATYLTGIERNADIVQMTAYAPLLARYGFTQWQDANLIWFDHKAVVRTPNYYVQQLFSLHKGDRYLTNESEFVMEPSGEVSAAYGHIGVGTWSTSAEFENVHIRSGETSLIEEDFSSRSDNWNVVSGRFEVQDGSYVQSATRSTPAVSLYRTAISAPEVVYSLRAKKTGGSEGFLVLFGSQASESFYWWNIGGWGNSMHAIEKGGASFRGGKTLVASRRGRIRSDVWYDIRIEIGDGRIKCFLDDKLIHDVEEYRPQIGVAASRENATGDILVKIANPLTRSCRTRINLRGVESVTPTAALTVLSGDKNDFNDLEHPQRIVPHASRIPVAKSFDYVIPSMSVQIIRVGQN